MPGLAGAGSASVGLLENVSTVAVSGAAQTIPDPFLTGITESAITLTAPCAVTLPTPRLGASFSVEFIQGGAGGFPITWAVAGGSLLIWQGLTPATIATAVGSHTVVTFACIDGAHWDGFPPAIASGQVPWTDTRIFGAKCDLQLVTGVTTTATNPCDVTVGAGTPFAATDVGKLVSVFSQATGVVAIAGTISAFISSTHVQVASLGTALAGTGVMLWCTDDAAATNAAGTAMLAANPNGGAIYVAGNSGCGSPINFAAGGQKNVVIQGNGGRVDGWNELQHLPASSLVCMFASAASFLDYHNNSGCGGERIGILCARSDYTGDLIDITGGATVATRSNDHEFRSSAIGAVGTSGRNNFTGPKDNGVGIDVDGAWGVTLFNCDLIGMKTSILGGKSGGQGFSNSIRLFGCNYAGWGTNSILNTSEGWAIVGGRVFLRWDSVPAGFLSGDGISTTLDGLEVSGVWHSDSASVTAGVMYSLNSLTAATGGGVSFRGVRFSGGSATIQVQLAQTIIGLSIEDCTWDGGVNLLDFSTFAVRSLRIRGVQNQSGSTAWYKNGPSASTQAIVSGTAFQLTGANGANNLYVPYSSAAAAGTIVVAVSWDNVTFTTIATIATLAGVGTTNILTIGGFNQGTWVKLTAVNATIAAGTYF